MNNILLVKRNAGGSYRVEFIKDSGRVRVRCNCDSGSVGQICRHQRWLIAGKTRVLSDPGQAALLGEILAWPEMQLLAARAAEYEKELAVVADKKTEIEQEEQVIKRRFSSDCLDGIHGD